MTTTDHQQAAKKLAQELDGLHLRSSFDLTEGAWRGLRALIAIVASIPAPQAPQERPEPAPEGDGTTDPDSGPETGAQRGDHGWRTMPPGSYVIDGEDRSDRYQCRHDGTGVVHLRHKDDAPAGARRFKAGDRVRMDDGSHSGIVWSLGADGGDTVHVVIDGDGTGVWVPAESLEPLPPVEPPTVEPTPDEIDRLRASLSEAEDTIARLRKERDAHAERALAFRAERVEIEGELAGAQIELDKARQERDEARVKRGDHWYRRTVEEFIAQAPGCRRAAGDASHNMPRCRGIHEGCAQAREFLATCLKAAEPTVVEPTPDWYRRTVETWLDTPGHPDDKPARGELQWRLNRAETGRPDLDDDHAFRPVRSVPDDDPAPTAPPVEPVEPTPAGVTVPPDASPTDSRFDAVGWKYGVRYHDGSVTAEWNGTTQRQHAVDLARLFPDAVVVRRRLNAEWQPAPADLTEVEPTPVPVSLPTTPGSVAWTRDGGTFELTDDEDCAPWCNLERRGDYYSKSNLDEFGGVVRVFDAGTGQVREFDAGTVA